MMIELKGRLFIHVCGAEAGKTRGLVATAGLDTDETVLDLFCVSIMISPHT